MLETDCKIPVEPVPIEPPEHSTLYGIDRAVQTMRAEGMKKWQICKKLRIGDDAWRDAIFEIRKQEAIEEMRGKKLTDEQRERIKMLRMAGAKIHEICVETGCPMSTVKRVLYADKPAESTQEPAQTAHIPAIVLRSTAKMIAQLNAEIAAAQDRLDTLRHDREELTAWLEVNGYDGDPAD